MNHQFKVADLPRITTYIFEDIRDLFDVIKRANIPVWRVDDALRRIGLDVLLRDPERAEEVLEDNDVHHDDRVKLHQAVAKWWEGRERKSG